MMAQEGAAERTAEVNTEMMAVAPFCPGCAVDVGQCAVEFGWLFMWRGCLFSAVVQIGFDR